ncbi:hypothetical protein AB0C29_07580 [Actinoplanes sp. NPDC048791]|uniref:hypothetical protein n=1 Tax=Actinoplanes sp. NPDC048791 TaxID=3154623 RepID=UPI0033F573A8
MTIRRISLPLLVALALAGCANGDSAGAPAPAPSAPPASSAAPVPTEESASVKPSAGTTTLTGTIAAGVEPNCLLLDDHLLIINDPEQRAAAKPGASVTVTGRVEQGMMTTCQQGTPFIVATLRAN